LISALLLGVAGVPEDIIAADYALSARYLIVRYLTEFPPPEQSASDYTWEDYQAEFCPPEAMLMTLAHLTQRYGGIDGYVRSIGLEPDAIGRLRAELLE
jgi:protein-tyrosine phosphatase